VQLLLVLVSGALMMFAGYSLGRYSGYVEGRAEDAIDVPRRPSLVQPAVLVVLGGISIVVALILERGGLQPPTPARLDELVGRAEAAAVDRASSPRDADNP
jgi:ABC-type dipeptide/oligopeptide/nickel transport system permease subunit